jgi:hypothetical protein
MKHIILIDNPQQLTDEEVNTLYNTADVGLNTTMGAGFELTNFEHGGMGFPQVAPYIGGIRDFLDNSCAKVLEPVVCIYTDSSGDGCPGKASIISPIDVADALEGYYADEDLRKEHGKKCRERILKNYRWPDLGEKFYKIIKKVADVPEEEQKPVDKISLDDIASLEKNLNINNLSDGRKKIPVVVEDESEEEEKHVEPLPKAPSSTPEVQSEDGNSSVKKTVSHESRKNDIKDRLKKKLEEKKKKLEMSELLKLKKQLDAIKT